MRRCADELPQDGSTVLPVMVANLEKSERLEYRFPNEEIGEYEEPAAKRPKLRDSTSPPKNRRSNTTQARISPAFSEEDDMAFDGEEKVRWTHPRTSSHGYSTQLSPSGLQNQRNTPNAGHKSTANNRKTASTVRAAPTPTQKNRLPTRQSTFHSDPTAQQQQRPRNASTWQNEEAAVELDLASIKAIGALTSLCTQHNISRTYSVLCSCKITRVKTTPCAQDSQYLVSSLRPQSFGRIP